jgi:hypothetical protein
MDALISHAGVLIEAPPRVKSSPSVIPTPLLPLVLVLIIYFLMDCEWLKVYSHCVHMTI